MFYKIAKTLSKVTIVFGFMCMVGGCSVEQQELFYLYEALGLAVFAVGAYAHEYFRMFRRDAATYKVIIDFLGDKRERAENANRFADLCEEDIFRKIP